MNDGLKKDTDVRREGRLETGDDLVNAVESVSPSAALIVAYDGGQFSGFARQLAVRTVQGSIESGLQTLLGRTVDTVGAGRTDAGVHARGQVVSFQLTPSETDTLLATPELRRRFRKSVEFLSGEGIAIREVRLARPGFSARFDAVQRTYRYHIASGGARPLFSGHVAWHIPQSLDIAAMRAAAQYLIGEHDFSSFCVTASAQQLREQGLSTCREVAAIDIRTEPIFGEDGLVIEVIGNAFLHSMVRVIVGSLVEVGLGRKAPEWLLEARDACARDAAGPTAPAQGLIFESVLYPADVWVARN